MLSPEELKEIEEEIKQYPHKRAACIEAMKVIQKHRRWVSDESLKDLSEVLEMSTDELDSVATFYNIIFRKPVGKHVVFVCDSVSCWVMGYQQILDYFKSSYNIKFGETTEDGRFTLLPIPCLGTCDHAPAMMVDNDLHRDLTKEKMDEILKRYE